MDRNEMVPLDFGVKMNSSHTHKARFWYLLGSDDHPVNFIWDPLLPGY